MHIMITTRLIPANFVFSHQANSLFTTMHIFIEGKNPNFP